ncbi:MAG: aldo/keto reductase [Bacteroidota bacterium]
MRYTLFGPSGLRVSELCLGTMTFGTEWGWGADYDTSKAIFDVYADAGGNFIDTANRYTEGTSERFVGEFIASDRDHFVLATKYTLHDKRDDISYSGNSRKNMIRSLEHSLKRMNTDYIDLFWVHMWDFTTPPEEILRGLDDLVSSGKILYIGISDTPAWRVSQMNTMAELRGWTSFAGLQIEYSLLQRTPERDLIPMAKAFDLAITPWGAIGGGALTGKYLKGEEGRVKEESARRSDRANTIAQAVVDVAEELGVTPAQVAIKWTMRQGVQSIPIVGARKTNQLEDSLKATEIEIPEEQLRKLNEVSAIELGFPHDFLSNENVMDVVHGGVYEKIKGWRK